MLDAVFQAVLMDAGDAGDAAGEADHRLLWRALGLEVTGHLELLEQAPLDAALLATQVPRLACLIVLFAQVF